jgi:hypothetical protein
MGVTVSYPVRIAAAGGLVLALVIGGGMMFLGRKSPSTPAPVVIKHHPFGPGVAKHDTVAKPHVTVAPKATKHPVSTKAPVVKVHHVPAPVLDQAAVAAGLPTSIARALAQHSVVVVEIYDPQSEVDAIAYAEAQAGAQDAGAGFLPLSVLGRDVSKLTQKFGQVLPDPGLLVYARPATLALRITGFVDRATVAQAAQNARPAGVPTVAAPTWWSRVNSVCASQKMHAPVLVPPASRAQVQNWVRQEVAWEKQTLTTVSAIPLSAAGTQRASAVTFLTLLRKAVADEEKVAAVLAGGGTFNMSLIQEDESLSSQALGLAAKMGATACAAS